MLRTRTLPWAPLTLFKAFKEAGKGPQSRDMLFHGCPHPSSARCGASREEPGPLRCLLECGAHTAGHMASDFWTILNKKAGVAHTETQIEVLGFKVKVFLEKHGWLCIWDFSAPSSAPRWVSWPLGSGITAQASPITAHTWDSS